MITITVAYFFATPQQAAFAQSEKEIKAIGGQSLEIWNKGNLSLIDKYFSPDFVRHNDLVGTEALKKNITFMRTAYPDLNVKMDELIVKDDKSIMRWTLTATNTGPRGKVPPTGKKVKVSGVTISRFINGKIVEQWHYFNMQAVWKQLGYTFTPPSTESKK